MSDNNKKIPMVGKDIPWTDIDGELLRVIRFTPFGKVENKKILGPPAPMPYALLTIQCKKIPTECDLPVNHKIDFMHLWEAFERRKIKEEEELLVFWSNKHYKNKIFEILSFILPKMWIMICPKGAFKLHTDPSYKPELSGEARWNASKSTIEWKPDVIE